MKFDGEVRMLKLGRHHDLKPVGCCRSSKLMGKESAAQRKKRHVWCRERYATDAIEADQKEGRRKGRQERKPRSTTDRSTENRTAAVEGKCRGA